MNVVEFDNTWGVLDTFGESFTTKLVICGGSCHHLFFIYFLFFYFYNSCSSVANSCFFPLFFAHQAKRLR